MVISSCEPCSTSSSRDIISDMSEDGISFGILVKSHHLNYGNGEMENDTKFDTPRTVPLVAPSLCLACRAFGITVHRETLDLVSNYHVYANKT